MIRGIWDRETVAALLLASLLPVAATWVQAEGFAGASRLLAVFLVIAIWQLVWMLARAQPPSLAGLATALAIAVLAPEGLAPLALLLSVSFGVVFGELAFGGWGRNVLNPATLALAFAGFGFPGAPWPDLAPQVGWAAWTGLLLAILFGVGSFRIVAGASLVFGLGFLWQGGGSPLVPILPVVLLLLVIDPVASASTAMGQWLNGALYSLLALLFSVTWPDVSGARFAVSAALLTSLAAPLFDEIAIAVWAARRRRRHG